MASEIRILEKFNSGAEEEALFKLLEIPGDLLPVLAAAFRTEHNPALRAFLVRVAWQRQDPNALHFMAEALNQTDEEVWQAALDGLVTFASPEALGVLMAAKTRDLGDQAATKRFQLFRQRGDRIYLPDYAALTTGREGPCYSRCKHQVRLPLVRRTG